jgi:hypothetical protein
MTTHFWSQNRIDGSIGIRPPEIDPRHIGCYADGYDANGLGRDPLFEQQRNVVDALCDDALDFIHTQSLTQSPIYLQIWANREVFHATLGRKYLCDRGHSTMPLAIHPYLVVYLQPPGNSDRSTIR